MGLTLHFQLQYDGDIAAAREVVAQMYELAQTMDFDTLIGVEEALAPADDPTPFNDVPRPEDVYTLRLKCTAYIDGPYPNDREDGSNLVPVEPDHMICFWAVNEGAEPALFGLARYPAEVEIQRFDQPVTCETGLGNGWHWHSFCKTQYAGATELGGWPHFLLAHQNLVRILDKADELGVKVRVHDDSEYWDHRDEAKLQETFHEWSSLIAAVAGRVKDRLGRSSVQAPILEDSAFEHLEAEGEQRWGDKLDEADRYIDEAREDGRE